MKSEGPNNSRLYILLASLSFIIPLSLLYMYNYFLDPIKIGGIEIKKIIPEDDFYTEKVHVVHEDKEIGKDQNVQTKKVLKINEKENQPRKFFSNATRDENEINLQTSLTSNLGGLDSTKQRILLMGDSECGGLCYQLNDYCIQNGHQLVASFVWNSATILNFAYSDTVNKIIEKYKPTYIFIVLGLNELYARDLTKRKQAAQILAKKIEGIPYTWVGPANYVNDRGINQVFYESAEKGSFYLTKKLNLPKGGDNRHPSSKGYRIWMDSLAVWVEKDAKYKIVLTPPVKRNRLYKTKIISLNAARYRGYK